MPRFSILIPSLLLLLLPHLFMPAIAQSQKKIEKPTEKKSEDKEDQNSGLSDIFLFPFFLFSSILDDDTEEKTPLQKGIVYYKKENYTEAVKYLRQAAETGEAEAQNLLGFCYLEGQGIEKDEAEAVRLFKLAADQDYHVAEVNLGYCYYNGDGVTQDYVQAAKYFHKAAFFKEVEGYYCYGMCLLYGIGVEQDVEAAKIWLQRAADKGHVEAKEELEQLELEATASLYYLLETELPLTIEGSSSYRAEISGSGTGDAGIAYSVRTSTGKLLTDVGLPKYTVTADSYWAHIRTSTEAAFLLVVDPNTTGAARTATITVTLEGESTSMTVYQPSNALTIKNVWAEFDQWRNMQKGMVIHTSFSTAGTRGMQGSIAAYFYFQNGNKLLDYNRNYGSVDGQVSTWSNFVPSYDATDFNDFQLFIPYTELHIQGAANLMYCVTVSINGQYQTSSYYNFMIQ